MAKYNDLGIRQCDQDGCKAVATHWLVWTSPMVCCVQHMEKALHVARVMGHPTPAATLRALMPDEQKMQVIADLLDGNEVRPTTVIVPDEQKLPTGYAQGGAITPGVAYLVGAAELPTDVVEKIKRQINSDMADVEDYWGE